MRVAISCAVLLLAPGVRSRGAPARGRSALGRAMQGGRGRHRGADARGGLHAGGAWLRARREPRAGDRVLPQRAAKRARATRASPGRASCTTAGTWSGSASSWPTSRGACTARSPRRCGMRLVASYEAEEPTQPREIRPVLRRLCKDQHGCRAWRAPRAPIGDDSPRRRSRRARAPRRRRRWTSGPRSSWRRSRHPRRRASPTRTRPRRPLPPVTLARCGRLSRAKRTPSTRGLIVSVTSTCDRRVRCQWCQAKGTRSWTVPRAARRSSTRGRARRTRSPLCKRDERGDSVAYHL